MEQTKRNLSGAKTENLNDKEGWKETWVEA